MFNLDVVNAFSMGTVSILRDYCGVKVSRNGNVQIQHAVSKINGFGIFIGIFGAVSARILVTMNNKTAFNLASVLNGEEMDKLDDIFVATLKEFTNTVCGVAINQLSTKGIDLDMTTPTIIMGEHVTLMERTEEKILVVNLDTSMGTIKLNIIIQEEE